MADNLTECPLNVSSRFTAKLEDCYTAKLEHRFASKLVNRLTATRLEARLTAKLVDSYARGPLDR